MVEFALPASGRILDPAAGGGAFLVAARREIGARAVEVEYCGVELDAGLVVREIPAHERKNIQIGDFMETTFASKFAGIVSNPPYLRHHRLTQEQKSSLRDLAVQNLGIALDGRAGLHAYFLIRSLGLLEKGGRLAFILPADVCEGVYSGPLWRWISSRFRIETILTFAPHATPFPGVDTNPIVLFIRNCTPRRDFRWSRCEQPDFPGLKQWVKNGFRASRLVKVVKRSVEDGLARGFARFPVVPGAVPTLAFGRFFRVCRGIATGANEFFFLTRPELEERGISEDFTVRAVGRTRDVGREILEEADLDILQASGRPTFLLALDGASRESLPERLRQYVAQGEALGLPQRPLIRQRSPWYKMEKRVVPPFLFAYLGRRNARFIRNLAGVVPLTGFLCVYPCASMNADELDRWWRLLQGEWLQDALHAVGKTYGGGAVKVEPRALERLPIPVPLLQTERLICESAEDCGQSVLFPVGR